MRSIQLPGFSAWYRSRISLAHIRRRARYLAISSKKSMWVLKIQLSRPANSSTSIPRSRVASIYAIALAKLKAISCTTVEPASRMW